LKRRPLSQKEVVSVFVLPSDEEMESIRKKVEVGLELDDWEIWVYRESWTTGKSGYTGSSCEVVNMENFEKPDLEKLKKIFVSLDDNEQFGLSFGLFPLRLEKYELAKEAAALIEIAQKKSGVEF